MDLKENFGELYRNNYTIVYSFIYNITTNKSLTEDIIQETFLKAYHRIDSFRYESKISTWLIKIAYNRYIDHTRKKSSSVLSMGEEALKNTLMDLKNNLFKDIEQKIMTECVQGKINLLPENYRAPIFLDMHGYKNQEIATILNCSLDNVKIRLYRAKEKLKNNLRNDCRFYYDERNVLC